MDKAGHSAWCVWSPVSRGLSGLVKLIALTALVGLIQGTFVADAAPLLSDF